MRRQGGFREVWRLHGGMFFVLYKICHVALIRSSIKSYRKLPAELGAVLTSKEILRALFAWHLEDSVSRGRCPVPRWERHGDALHGARSAAEGALPGNQDGLAVTACLSWRGGYHEEFLQSWPPQGTEFHICHLPSGETGFWYALKAISQVTEERAVSRNKPGLPEGPTYEPSEISARRKILQQLHQAERFPETLPRDSVSKASGNYLSKYYVQYERERSSGWPECKGEEERPVRDDPPGGRRGRAAGCVGCGEARQHQGEDRLLRSPAVQRQQPAGLHETQKHVGHRRENSQTAEKIGRSQKSQDPTGKDEGSQRQVLSAGAVRVRHRALLRALRY